MSEKLKDRFFTKTALDELAHHLQVAYPPFDKSRFLALVHDSTWENLELKAKMHHVTQSLHQVLPEDYRQALGILEQVAPQTAGFEAMVFPDYVEHYGLDDWERSLPALRYFTRFASSEFAVRPFIIQNQSAALAAMLAWSQDENHHVRRLSSEGCRPRLPWAMALPALKKDPSPILPILEQLRDDASEYVRRSVANNLNDISKDHPEIVLTICERWQGHSQRTDWIIKHACRTLLKSGDPRAMRLFGFEDPAGISVQNLAVGQTPLNIGETLTFSFDLSVETTHAAKVRLAYNVDYVKARDKRSRKVFHIREANFQPGLHPIRKQHSFADRSTRKHYPGTHHITVVVNGVEKGSISVELV